MRCECKKVLFAASERWQSQGEVSQCLSESYVGVNNLITVWGKPRFVWEGQMGAGVVVTKWPLLKIGSTITAMWLEVNHYLTVPEFHYLGIHMILVTKPCLYGLLTLEECLAKGVSGSRNPAGVLLPKLNSLARTLHLLGGSGEAPFSS